MNEIRLNNPVFSHARWSSSIWQQWIRQLRQRLALQRQRRALAKLDERLLRDIGVSVESAQREFEKPIWRD